MEALWVEKILLGLSKLYQRKPKGEKKEREI